MITHTYICCCLFPVKNDTLYTIECVTFLYNQQLSKFHITTTTFVLCHIMKATVAQDHRNFQFHYSYMGSPQCVLFIVMVCIQMSSRSLMCSQVELFGRCLNHRAQRQLYFQKVGSGHGESSLGAWPGRFVSVPGPPSSLLLPVPHTLSSSPPPCSLPCCSALSS